MARGVGGGVEQGQGWLPAAARSPERGKTGAARRRGVASSRRASRGEEWGQGGAREGGWQASSGEEASRGRENHGGGWSRAPADREEEEED